MDGEVQRADPRARRNALAIVLAATVAGAIAIAALTAFRPAIEDWIAIDVINRARVAIVTVTIMSVGPLAGLSVYLWRLAARVVRDQRYPPHDARVIRDTPVISGTGAAQLARAIRLFAGMMAFFGLVLAYVMWRLMALIAGGRPES